MVRSRYLLLLFLLVLQAQNAQSAPAPGQGAVQAREHSPPAPQADSMLIPSWYLKQTDHEIVQKKIYPMGESNSVPGSDEEAEGVMDTRTPAQDERHIGRSAAVQKAKTAGQLEFSKNYILVSAAVSALLLLAAVVGYIIVYELLKRDKRIQGDKEASMESNTYSVWDSKDHSKIKGEAE
nr:uncharacterized protein LOC115490968 isoform X2 [Taeniopygia guttata]